MSWYVVLDGWTPGVFGDKRQAIKSVKDYYGEGDNSKFYTFKTMEDALSKYNEYLCDRLNLPNMSSSNLHMNSIRYELMPRHRGQISVIPDSINTYQLTVSVNLTYNYIVFVFYNYHEVYFTVAEIPRNTSVIKQYLCAISWFTQFKPNSTLLIHEQSIGMAFEQGWIYQWVTHSIYVKDYELWRHTYDCIKRNRVIIKYHPRYLVADQVIEGVQWEIFRRHYKVLRERNKDAYDTQYKDYYYEGNIPPVESFTIKELPHLSTLPKY